MTRFLRLSIRARLVALAAGSATIALCLVTGVMAARDYREMRRARIAHVLLQADLISLNVAPVLSSRDRETTNRVLRTLEGLAPIDSVTLRDATGQVVASIGEHHFSDMKSRGWQLMENGDLLAYRPIVHRGKTVGEVVLRATFVDVMERFTERLKTAGTVLAAAVTVSALAAFLLQRGITGSILALASTAERVRLDQNVELSITHHRTDELGILSRAFNTMLERLQASKRAVESAHLDLENRVAERTRQLVDEIHRRESVQVELIRARDEARSANRTKSEFLANMSHEVRTPLNAIIGYTDLLRQSPHDVDREFFLDTIESNGERLLHLMADMLEMSQHEAGNASVVLSSFSPKRLFDEVLEAHRPAAVAKGLSIDLIWTSPVPETAVCDPGKIRQLLDNLVSNAVKFTEEGHVQIFAGFDDAVRTLSVDVSDSGIGIPDDKRQSIFETFTQVDASMTRKYGGTGLGLALSRRIVRLLGGQLSVRSAEGKGSTFSLVLPLGPLADIAPPAPEVSEIKAPFSLRRLPSGRVPGVMTATELAITPYSPTGGQPAPRSTVGSAPVELASLGRTASPLRSH